MCIAEMPARPDRRTVREAILGDVAWPARECQPGTKGGNPAIARGHRKMRIDDAGHSADSLHRIKTTDEIESGGQDERDSVTTLDAFRQELASEIFGVAGKPAITQRVVRSELKRVAGRQGLEPRYAGPEPAVLPLNDLPAMKV
jgi:hypothetical protein